MTVLWEPFSTTEGGARAGRVRSARLGGGAGTARAAGPGGSDATGGVS